jgi:hypothetical protein
MNMFQTTYRYARISLHCVVHGLGGAARRLPVLKAARRILGAVVEVVRVVQAPRLVSWALLRFYRKEQNIMGMKSHLKE